MRRFIAAFAVAILLMSTLTPVVAAAPAEAVPPALDWLRQQQQPDGGFAGLGDTSDPGTSVDAALAFAAAGVDPALVTAGGPSVLAYLAEQADSYATTTAGAAKLILAAVAAGVDPRDFGGVDLIERLLDHLDADTGLFDSQIYMHAYGVLALAASGETIPASAIEAIHAAQGPDGGWAFTGDRTPGASDSNTTSVVIQALVAAGKRASTEVDRGIGYLRAAQTNDGSFVYQVGFESPAVGDANSTALAIQALIAAVQKPASTSWGNAPAALQGFQNPSGAFRYRDDWPDDNLLATAQAIPALLQKPLPIKAQPGFGRATDRDRALQPARPKDGCVHYVETGHNLCAGFQAFWMEFGGLPVFGYPVTEEFIENGVTVQYFERARFEWHPGAAPERYDVVLGRIGAEATRTRADEAAFQPATPADTDDCLYFAETGHNVCAGFNQYWQHYGGLTVFGYPLSEEFVEDGLTVQYFERARFEWHPGAAPAHFDVLGGRLGAEALETN